jgi:hypothetical protein
MSSLRERSTVPSASRLTTSCSSSWRRLRSSGQSSVNALSSNLSYNLGVYNNQMRNGGSNTSSYLSLNRAQHSAQRLALDHQLQQQLAQAEIQLRAVGQSNGHRPVERQRPEQQPEL